MEKFFVSRPIFALSLAIVIVLVGLISILNLPIEQYPDITPPVVEVSATYDGADAETVNNAVATPVAQSVMGVSDMLYLQTTSANDGSMVMQVTFDIGSDPALDAIFTQNNVSSATAQLPLTVTKQGVTTRKTMTGFLLVFSLHSDGRYDAEFLSNYAYINLQNELLKINGVGKVSIMGAGEYAMRIWLKPDVLKYYGIPVSAVTAAIENQGGIYPAGQFGAEPAPDGTTYTYTVTMPPQITTPAQFGDIVVVTTSEGQQIRLCDVAEVSLGSQSYGVSSLFEGKPTAMIVVYQQPGSNAVEVGKKVRAAMARLEKRMPDGIAATTIVDTTTSIDAGIRDIFHTLVIALLLVIFIIYLFIQDWRATVIPLVAIPVSLIGAFALFPLLGFSVNIISLLGLVLAIGLVVDDAIVVVEAAQVNIAAGMRPRAAALEAMKNVASPIVATTVVLLAVFVPVSFTGGITGRLFQQFSITIAVSVVISAFNALTLSPALCALLLRRREPPQKGFFAAFNRSFSRNMDRYTAFTPTLIRHVTRTGVFIAVVLAVIFVVWRKLPAGFLPEEDQGYVMVMVSTPEASALPVTQAAMEEADAVIRTLPEVASTSFAAGFNMMAGIASTDSGIIFVSLVDFADRKLSAMEIAQKLTDELYVAVPGAECYAFIPPSIPGLGITSGVSVEVQDLEGRGTAYLLAQAGRLMDSLRKQPSIASVTTQFNAGVPQRRLRIDKEQALAAGVDLGVLYGELTTLLGGAYINNFSRFGKLYQTYIQAAPVRGGGRHGGRGIRLAVQPLPLDLPHGDARGTRLDHDRHAGDHPYGRRGAARRHRHGVERHLLPGSQCLEDGRAGLPAGAGVRLPGPRGALRVVGTAAGDPDERPRRGAGRRALHRGIAPAGRLLRQRRLHADFAGHAHRPGGQECHPGCGICRPAVQRKRPVADGRRDRRRQTARAADHHDRLRVHPRRHAAGIRQRGLRHGTQHHGRGTGGRYAVRHAAGHLRLPGTLLFRGAHREFRTPPRTQKTGGKTMKTGYLTLIFALACAACTPRFYPPKVDVPDGYLYGEGFPRDTAALASDWWRLFGDTVLDNLVQRALENNRDVAVAASRVEEARQNLGVVRAQFLPQVGIGVTAEGEYTPQTKIVQTYAVEPSLSWEIALFGQLRNAKRAARAQIASSEWALRGVRLSLAAEVATTYFTLLEYERDLAIARRSCTLRRESAALIDSMFRYGMSDGVALEQARSLVYTAEADIPQYERAVKQTRLSLDILLGETPQAADSTGSGLRLLADRHPADIPVGLPSELLKRRPDIMEARYNMLQAAANAGVARGARFPSIALTAKGGIASNSIKGLTAANPWAWDALGSLTQPLFAFGKLRRSELAAMERYTQAAKSYEQTVLTAFADVEKALVAIATYRTQAERSCELVVSNDRIATMTQALYRSGLSDYLDVIDAQRSLYQSQMELVNIVAQQYINYVNLCKALGGGW